MSAEQDFDEGYATAVNDYLRCEGAASRDEVREENSEFRLMLTRIMLRGGPQGRMAKEVLDRFAPKD